MKFETRAIHAGQPHDECTGAVNVPVYLSSTYAQESPGKHKGFEYSRTQNPTRKALEECIASLEGGRYGLAFSSGMGATNNILNMFPTGSHIISTDDVYGGTYRLFEKLYRNFGFSFSFVDTTDSTNVENAITSDTKLIWIETPTNPLLRLVDLEQLAEIARGHKILTVVDNTFATPYFQKPFDFGIDIVVHSVTKYLGGHSDVVGGAIVVKDPELYEKLHFYQNTVGSVPGAFDSYLVLRGLKTLAVRMKEHFHNVMKIAPWLEEHALVKRVHFPFLRSHPQYELAKRQMSGMSGMVSFEIDGDLAMVRRFLEEVKVFTLAESLGGVESLIEHPAIMTHASIPRETRENIGITDGLIRLSVGIENVDDLMADLDNALRKCQG